MAEVDLWPRIYGISFCTFSYLHFS